MQYLSKTLFGKVTKAGTITIPKIKVMWDEADEKKSL